MGNKMASNDTNELNSYKLEEYESKRSLSGYPKKIVYILAVIMSLVHIYALGIHAITIWYLYCFHIGMAVVLTLAIYRERTKSVGNSIPFYDYLLIAATVFAFGYLTIETDLVYRIGVSPTDLDVVVAIIMIFVILEFTRRTCGNILPIIAIIFLLYARFGHLIPGTYGHRPYSWAKTLSYMMGLDGVFSTPIQASASFVFLFIVFGAFLSASGAAKVFIDLAVSVSGRYRGGPAKVAVISSALFGTVSGNSVANVVASGSFTIPLMKSIGYRKEFAGAVEATASTGGQIMPPILGAAAFIMASIVGIPYIEIVKASVIPALLYFYTVYVTVHLEAVKYNLRGLPEDKLPKFSRIIINEGFLIIPLVVLILALAVFNLSPIRAAIWAIGTTIAVTYLRKEMRLGIKGIFNALADGGKSACSIIAACATAGIVIGVMNLTGVGIKFASFIVALSGGNLGGALVLTMVACIVMGMGLPTTAAYLICASVASPALSQLGVSPLPAHMFVFYFACISAITPPVALAAYAGAGIAKARPIEVAFTACKLGATAFIVPFMFVYGPALLGVGAASEILLATVTAVIGSTLIAIGLQRQAFFLKLGWFPGALLVLCGVGLVKPGIITDLIGFLGASAVLTISYLKSKKIRSPGATT